MIIRIEKRFMNAYVVSLSKYVNTGILALFMLLSFLAFAFRRPLAGRVIEVVQRILLVAFLVNSYVTIAWMVGEGTILHNRRARNLMLLCAMEILFLMSFMVLYRIVHEMASMVLFNNLCMLLSIGFVIIGRISYYGSQESTGYRSGEPLKQFIMASAGLMLMLIIPFFRRFFDSMRHLGIIFGIAGIVMLGGVLVLSAATNGAMITYTVAGFTFQPSEFVKILFILMTAALLSGEVTRTQVVFVTVFAVLHVGILVLSRDLGGALIFFVVYLMMLFMGTGKWRVIIAGGLLGAAGAVMCFLLFYHFRVRVQIWRDPFEVIDTLGYQVAQSLFALSYGGPWGAGLTQGMPTQIPFVESDFIFAAITEEMGLVFGVCLLLLCINCFIRVLMLSAGYSNRFFQLFTYGAAVCYIFQTFLTVGGETKFIPLTGVTLPLVSYGGSSILSTLIMFGMLEMIFILHNERTARFVARYEEEHYGASGQFGSGAYPGNNDPSSSAPAGFTNASGQFGSGAYPGNDDPPSSAPAGFTVTSDTDPSSSPWFRPAGPLAGDPAGTMPGEGGDYIPDNFPVNGVSEEGIFDD